MSIHPPLTAMQRNVWILSALGVALDGFDFFIIGVAMPQIQEAFQASAWQVGLIGAAAVLGAVVGALGLGPLTDKFGRKTIFLIDLGFFVVFSVLSALAWDVWSLILFRFLLGVGIGADYPISATYVAETMPSHIRGRMVASTIGFQAAGHAGRRAGGPGGAADSIRTSDAWRWMLALRRGAGAVHSHHAFAGAGKPALAGVAGPAGRSRRKPPPRCWGRKASAPHRPDAGGASGQGRNHAGRCFRPA